MGLELKYLPPYKQKRLIPFLRIPFIVATLAVIGLFFLNLGISIPVKVFLATLLFSTVLILPTLFFMKRNYSVIELEVHEDRLTVFNTKTGNKHAIYPQDIKYAYFTNKKEDILVKTNDPEKDIYLYNNQVSSSHDGQRLLRDLKEWFGKHRIKKGS